MDLVALLFVLAIVGGLTIGTGMIADRKGYNFLLFAVLGFFLGIFGMLIAAVLPKKKPALEDV